jgi:hypothetical protein
MRLYNAIQKSDDSFSIALLSSSYAELLFKMKLDDADIGNVMLRYENEWKRIALGGLESKVVSN